MVRNIDPAAGSVNVIVDFFVGKVNYVNLTNFFHQGFNSFQVLVANCIIVCSPDPELPDCFRYSYMTNSLVTGIGLIKFTCGLQQKRAILQVWIPMKYHV